MIEGTINPNYPPINAPQALHNPGFFFKFNPSTIWQSASQENVGKFSNLFSFFADGNAIVFGARPTLFFLVIINNVVTILNLFSISFILGAVPATASSSAKIEVLYTPNSSCR